MTEVTGKIASKGCQATGITEDMLDTAYDQLVGGNNGVKKTLAIVELVPDTYGGKTGGKRSVGFSILTLEPSPTPLTDDHLQNLMRSFHYERQLADGQLRIETEDDLEPNVADVLKAGAYLKPHTFDRDPDEKEDVVCLCGELEDNSLHDTDRIPDPFALPQVDEQLDLEASESEDPDAT